MYVDLKTFGLDTKQANKCKHFKKNLKLKKCACFFEMICFLGYLVLYTLIVVFTLIRWIIL